MNKSFDFNKINQYDTYIIKINKKDYEKMQECIYNLTKKYDYIIKKIYVIEKNNTKQFEFNNQRKFITSHKKLLINIVNDVLKIYNEELNDLSVVFLSGSFARGTNKMSSDVDLHFFYKNDDYNYIYEEIISYIISRVINKSRDCIDPTFIFNIQSENKTMITSKMDKSKLRVILKYKNKEIKYSYKNGKKRRFYLQYTNTRDINKLFNYLNNEMNEDNEEWCHCFEVIKGKNIFNKLYDKMYIQEQNFINNDYINNKITVLKKIIKDSKKNIISSSISQYKNYYQSKTFEWIYEYISIIRFILIKENHIVKYLNLLDIYDMIEENSIINKDILIKIYKYMWNLEKLSVYCYENKINYGLHNDDVIDYSTKELDKNLELLKNQVLDDLERLCGLYE
ncbi:MAG: nucleotidyltransferase domain-containing protein [Bacilli bacterium]